MLKRCASVCVGRQHLISYELCAFRYFSSINDSDGLKKCAHNDICVFMDLFTGILWSLGRHGKFTFMYRALPPGNALRSMHIYDESKQKTNGE